MTNHIRELDFPPDSAIHQALAVFRDERDAYRREALYYRGVLQGVYILSETPNDLTIARVRSIARRALLLGPDTRPRRRRIRAWWDRVVGRWQTIVARRKVKGG